MKNGIYLLQNSIFFNFKWKSSTFGGSASTTQEEEEEKN
jgi:hypothetical protein